MLIVRVVLVVLAAVLAFAGVNLVVGGGIGSILGGIALLALALGLFLLSVRVLRGSAEEVVRRLTSRRAELEQRAGRTSAAPEAPAAPMNRAARRASRRRS